MSTIPPKVLLRSAVTLPGGKPLWSTPVRVEVPEAKGHPGHVPAMRLLAQSPHSRELPKVKIAFHDPLAFAASVEVLDETASIADAHGWIMPAEPKALSHVVVASMEAAKAGGEHPIRIPAVRMLSGEIRARIIQARPLTSFLWKFLGLPGDVPDADRQAAIFDEEAPSNPAMRIDVGEAIVEAFPRRQRSIEVILVPEGLAFEVDLDDPFGGKGTYRIGVCLTHDGTEAGGWRLVPYPRDRAGAFRKRFDAVMQELRQDNPAVALDVKPGLLAPLFWNLSEEGGRLRAATPPALEANSLRATLLSGRARGAMLGAAAQLQIARARFALSDGAAGLMLEGQAPLAAEGVRASLEWKSGAAPVSPDAPVSERFDARLGAPTSKNPHGPFAAVAETRELEEVLTLGGRKAGVIGEHARATFAFVPLERGVLQLPLRFPGRRELAPQAPRSAFTPRSAFSGLVVAAIQQGATPLAPVLELTGARTFRLELAKGSGNTSRIVLDDCIGTLHGALWACEAAPTPEDILPPLDAGALATRSVPIVFGNAAAEGWRLQLQPLNRLPTTGKGPAVASDVAILGGWHHEERPTAWLAAPGTALVSAMPMTRTRPSPMSPSATRDLVPHEYRCTPRKSGEAEAVVQGSIALVTREWGTLPSLRTRGVKLAPTRWPARGDGNENATDGKAVAHVSLVPILLPGVELSFSRAEVDGAEDLFTLLKGALRFDLPILDELFASAAVPRKTGERSLPEAVPTTLDMAALEASWQATARRRALSRTAHDAMTGWLPLNTPHRVKVTGLAQPHSWEVEVGIEMTPGSAARGHEAYLLDGEAHTGSGALRGLTADFRIDDDGNIAIGTAPEARTWHVVGNAAQLRFDGDWSWDSSGHARTHATALEGRLEFREIDSAHANEVRRAVTIDAIPVLIGDSPATFRARDLPMRVTRAGASEVAVFEMGDSRLESTRSTGGDAFDAAAIEAAVHEWSLAPAGGDAFSIEAGALRFRPLRLAGLALAGDSGSWRGQRLEVIGMIETPRDIGSGAEAIRDDMPYAAGSVVALEFSGTRLALSKISPVSIADGRIAVDREESAAPWVRLEGRADVTYGGAAVAGLSSDDVRVSCEFEMAVTGGKLCAQRTRLTTRLFGGDLVLDAGPVALEGEEIVVVFEAAPSKGAGVHVRKVSLRWKSAEAHPRLELDAELILATVDGFEAVRGPVGGILQWLDVAVAPRPDSFRIDHAEGTIRGLLGMKAPKALLRGLALPGDIEATVGLMLALAPAAKEWPRIPFSAGVAELVVSRAGDDSEAHVRHRLVLQDRAPGFDSDLRLTLGVLKRQSLIQWPVEALKPQAAQQGAVAVGFDAQAAALMHKIGVTLRDVPLDCALLVRTREGVAFAHPWRITVPAEHQLCEPGEAGPTVAQWLALEQVCLSDFQAVWRDARRDTQDPAKGAYAFAPRYRIDIALAERQRSFAPQDGILSRAFARAGLPGWEMAQGIAALGEPAAGRLVLLACSLLDIETSPASAHSSATGIVLAMPWIAPLGEEPLPELGPITQGTGRDHGTFAVSAFDADNGEPRALGEPPLTLGLADGSSLAIDAALKGLLVGAKRIAFEPVTQSVAVGPEDETGFDPANPGGGWLDRPIFWRTLFGWRGVLKALRARSVAQDFAGTVQTLLPVEDGLPGKGRVSWRRIAVRRSVAVPPLPAVEMQVLTRGRIHVLTLPEDEAAPLILGHAPIHGDAGQRLATYALRVATDPLAACVGIRGAGAPVQAARRIVRMLQPPRSRVAREQASPLRDRAQALPASPAVGWPRMPAATELPRLGLSLRGGKGHRLLQDPEHAWAGEALALSGPAFAWPSEDPGAGKKAAFLALSQRAVFRRPPDDNVVAPPDRALSPVPPRTRVPVASALREALSKARLKDGPDTLAPLLPPRFETVVTGRRPGVIFFQSQGLVLSGTVQDMDADDPRFGRPAWRGPVSWHHARAPRSTALPRKAPADRGRRTFVAEDRTRGDDLLPFLAVRGSVAVLRYPRQEKLLSVTVAPSANQPALTARWEGTLTLAIRTSPSDVSEQALADLGFIAANPFHAELTIGAASFAFSQGKRSALAGDTVTLQISLSSRDAAAARAALQVAGAREAPFVSLTLGPWNEGATLVAADTPFDLAAAKPRVPIGPPRTLALPIDAEPQERAFLPLASATLVFGDRAYDRELGSKTLQATRGEFLLAADRVEYDPSSVIHFAVGPVVAVPGKPIAWTGDAFQAKLDFTYIPRSERSAAAVQTPLAISGVHGRSGSAPVLDVNKPDPLAIAVSSFRLKTPEGPAPDFRQGDKILIRATIGSTSLEIRVAIVEIAVIAPPAAVYGLVTWSGPQASRDDAAPENALPTAALFASAPLPQVVEFPNLRGDLALGHVRRRALFVWRFIPRGGGTGRLLATLVKYDRTGGAQLPESANDYLDVT